MARPLRIEFPGALYHITSRGNARSDIFLDSSDRTRFLDLLGKVCERYNWQCYAYCLMTNHYHVVVETAEANLAQGMRQLNGVYTQTFNRHHHRVGHIFQGRYISILVARDSYLLEVIRYVLLNPVRANMTRTAGQYPWNSYRAMIDKEPCPHWLGKAAVLGNFGDRMKTAQQKFIQFIKQGDRHSGLWDKVLYQIYLGDEQFVTKMQKYREYAGDLGEIPRVQRREKVRPLEYYRNRYTTKVAMKKAYESGGYTLKEIAACFGVHYSTVSRAVKQM